MPEKNAKQPSPYLKPVVAVLALAAVGEGAIIYEQKQEIKALKAAALSVNLCPVDQYPGDINTCGKNGKPKCGVATWSGTSSSGTCKVIQLTNTSGCSVCYEGQVTTCDKNNYTKPCDGHGSSTNCGVKYCTGPSGGPYNWETSCRVVN